MLQEISDIWEEF